MRKLIAILAGLGFSVAGFGQDLLQCLDPHLVTAVIAPGMTRITSGVPDELEGYVVPPGFEWIGAIEGESMTVIALKTALDPAAATAAVLESLRAAGFRQPAPPGLSFQRTFVLENDASVGTPLCLGEMQGGLIVRDVAGARFVSVSWRPSTSSSLCRSPSSGRLSLLDGRGPTLRFREGTVDTSGGVSSGDSDRDSRTTIYVTSDDAPGAIVDHLGEQMAEQGFSIDSRWQGRQGAGATWSRDSDIGRLVATLEIVAFEDETMEVQLRLRAP